MGHTILALLLSTLLLCSVFGILNLAGQNIAPKRELSEHFTSIPEVPQYVIEMPKYSATSILGKVLR